MPVRDKSIPIDSAALVNAACSRQGLRHEDLEKDKQEISELHEKMSKAALADFNLDLKAVPIPSWAERSLNPSLLQKQPATDNLSLYISREQMRAAYLAKHIMPLLNDAPDGNIADIGTRSGFFPQRMQNLLRLTGQKREISGLDLIQELPTAGNNDWDFRNGQNPLVKTYDGKNMPYEDKSLAAVTLNFTLHHVETPTPNPGRESEKIDSFLTEVNRVLKPGGVLVVTEDYMGKSREERTKGNIYNDTIIKVDNMFYPESLGSQRSQGEWTDLLKKNGFKVEQEKHIAGYNVAGLPVVELLIKARKAE